MATISTSLRMYDMMSRPLQQVTQALNLTIASMEHMNNSGNRDLGITNSLNAARNSIRQAEAGLIELSSEQDRVRNSQNNLNNSFRNSGSATDSLAGKVRNLIGAYIGLRTAGEIIKTSDEFVQTKARLDLMNDGLQTTEQLQQKIFQSAQNSRGAYTDTAKTVSKLGILAKGAFSGNDEIIAFAELMNKSFKIGGSGIQEQTAGMYQLTQAMAAGKLQGDEFRSVMENAPMLAQAIAKFTGKSTGELKVMSAKGTITADIIRNSLFAAADDINVKFKTMPMTWGEIATSIKNKAIMAFEPVLLKINEIANLPGFGILVNNIVNSFSTIGLIILGVIQLISSISGFVQNNWSIISPILFGVIAALIVYKGIMLASSIATGAATLANSLHAVSEYSKLRALASAEIALYGEATAQTVSEMATASATAAQWGFNAALLACPITWIILAIVALIVIFYGAVAAVNHFAGTSYSATGLIAGAFSALGVMIYNSIAYSWNAVAAFVEFIANVFFNPIYSVKKLFANLATNVLDMCISMTSGFDSFATNMANSIIDGVNAAVQGLNWFIEKCNEVLKTDFGTFGTFEHTASITSTFENTKSNINAWVGEAPSDYWTAPKMEMKSVGGAFDWGYGKGAGLESKVGNMFNSPGVNDMGAGIDTSKFGSDLGKNADSGAKSLKNIDDKIDVSNEHLEMLRDMAEEKSIQNFVTLTPTVTFGDTHVKEEADINKIMSHIENYMENELQNSAEGLYE